jgi:hypothetical protein
MGLVQFEPTPPWRLPADSPQGKWGHIGPLALAGSPELEVPPAAERSFRLRLRPEILPFWLSVFLKTWLVAFLQTGAGVLRPFG